VNLYGIAAAGQRLTCRSKGYHRIEKSKLDWWIVERRIEGEPGGDDQRAGKPDVPTPPE
jgi:hypothetical protein